MATSMPVFLRKYSLKKRFFLHSYQVISDTPGHLKTKVKSYDSTSGSISHKDPESFRVTENVDINLLKANSKYYLLIIHRKYNDQYTSPRRCN